MSRGFNLNEIKFDYKVEKNASALAQPSKHYLLALHSFFYLFRTQDLEVIC